MLKKFRYTIYAGILTAFVLYNFFPYCIIDKEVQPMLQDFQVRMWEKCDKQIHPTWQIAIELEDKLKFADKEVIGRCLIKPVGFNIELLRSYWELSTETQKRELLYHELLHCYLGIKHQKNTLMNEYAMNYNEFDLNEQLNLFLNQACRSK